MKSQHTPGPWHTDGLSRSCDWEPRCTQVKAFHPGETIPIKKVATVYYGDDAERAANARLIAAAPELLEALSMTTHCLAWHEKQHGVGMDRAAVTAARAAIAKATGGVA